MGRRGKEPEQALYAQIRTALTNGESQREIALRLHCSRVTVAKASKTMHENSQKMIHSPLQENDPLPQFTRGERVICNGLPKVIDLVNADGTLRLIYPTGLFYRDCVKPGAGGQETGRIMTAVLFILSPHYGITAEYARRHGIRRNQFQHIHRAEDVLGRPDNTLVIVVERDRRGDFATHPEYWELFHKLRSLGANYTWVYRRMEEPPPRTSIPGDGTPVRPG